MEKTNIFHFWTAFFHQYLSRAVVSPHSALNSTNNEKKKKKKKKKKRSRKVTHITHYSYIHTFNIDENKNETFKPPIEMIVSFRNPSANGQTFNIPTNTFKHFELIAFANVASGKTFLVLWVLNNGFLSHTFFFRTSFVNQVFLVNWWWAFNSQIVFLSFLVELTIWRVMKSFFTINDSKLLLWNNVRIHLMDLKITCSRECK